MVSVSPSCTNRAAKNAISSCVLPCAIHVASAVITAAHSHEVIMITLIQVMRV